MISQLIKKIMKETGLKQAPLAEVIGASLSRVKALATGRAQKLTREESEALVKKLNIRAEWLVTGEGPMFRAVDAPQSRQVNQDVAPYGLKPDEAVLLAAYRRSTLSMQEAALRMLDAAVPPTGAMPDGLEMKRPGGGEISTAMRSGSPPDARPSHRKKKGGGA